VLQFSKYQGLGNDFLLLDARAGTGLDPGSLCDALAPETVRRLCDRRFGVGADGLILALPPRGEGELRMRIFNADGSEPEMCGNGIRCLARFLADSDGDPPGRSWVIETLAGLIVPELQGDGRIRVDMGPPLLEPTQVPTTSPIGPAGLPQGELEVEGLQLAVAAAGMGNPHVVIPVTDLDLVELDLLGPALERHPAFPARTNVHFVQVLQPGHLVMRVWERGAGPTLACGTGACATLAACHLLGLSDRSARLDLPGGPLHVLWDDTSGHLFMTGPAEAVFEGVLAPDLFPSQATAGNTTAQPDPLTPVPVPAGVASAEADRAVSRTAPVSADSRSDMPVPAIDCSTACVNGCLMPQACASAEARARVEALLGGRSLDELVDLATNSLESRTRARLQLEGDRGG